MTQRQYAIQYKSYRDLDNPVIMAISTIDYEVFNLIVDNREYFSAVEFSVEPLKNNTGSTRIITTSDYLIYSLAVALYKSKK